MKSLRDHHIWVVPTQSLAERWFSPAKDAEGFSKEPEMKYMSRTEIKNWMDAKNSLMNNPAYNTERIKDFIWLRRKLIYECNKNGVGLLLGSDAPRYLMYPDFPFTMNCNSS